jgi:hypothetical protein
MSNEQKTLVELEPGQEVEINGKRVTRTNRGFWEIRCGFSWPVTCYDLPTALKMVQP